jgi:hypothetical protein
MGALPVPSKILFLCGVCGFSEPQRSGYLAMEIPGHNKTILTSTFTINHLLLRFLREADCGVVAYWSLD